MRFSDYSPMKKAFTIFTYLLFVVSAGHFVWAFYSISSYTISHLHLVVPDFAWFYLSFRDVLFHGGRTLYSLPAQHAWLDRHHITHTRQNLYAYPPLFAVIFAPLGWLSFDQAYWIWNLLSAVAYLAMVVIIASWATTNWTARLLVGSFALGFYPLFENFFMGQVDVFLALLVSLGFYFIYAQRKQIAGGALIALGACIKVTPAIFLVFWLVQRRWKIIEGATAVVVLSILATSFVIPLSLYPYYVLHTLSQVNTVDFRYGGAPWNGSFKGILMVTRLRGLAPASAWIAGFGTLAVFLWYFLKWSPDRYHDPRLTAAFLGFLILFASPLIEIHTWLLVVTPLILISGYWLDKIIRSSRPPKMNQLIGVTLLFLAWMLLIIPDTQFVMPAVNGTNLIRHWIGAGIFSPHRVFTGYIALPIGHDGLGSILIAIQHMTATLMAFIAVILGLMDDKTASPVIASNLRTISQN